MEKGFFGTALRGIIKQVNDAEVGSEVLQQRRLAISLMITPLLKGKKYRVARKMAKLLIKAHIGKEEGVSNFLLAKCLGIKFDETNPKLTKTRYKEKTQKYNDVIQNRFRTLKKVWNPKGYDVQFNKKKNESKIVIIDIA